MRKLIFVIFTALAVIQYSSAQSVRQPALSPYLKSATYSSSQSDAFSFTGNQAVLAGVKGFSGGVFGEKRFMLQDLSSFTSVVVMPSQSGSFGLSLNYFGNAGYNDLQLGLAYGRKLAEKLDAGVQFNYTNIHVSGYGNASVVNLEGGLIFHFSDFFHGGLHCYNPVGGFYGKGREEKLPAIYTMGFGYDVSDRLLISGSMEKVEDKPVSWNGGLHYKLDDRLFARGGFSGAASQFFFGIGFLKGAMRCDATVSMHPYLGISPGILIIFNAAGKE